MKKGFTLIEALVVVGIIAVTAAIVMPVFMRSHGSNKSSCQNNLKVLGLGLAQYTQDYDERLPLVFVTSTSDISSSFSGDFSKATYYGWADAIWPYMKGNLWFHCPTFKHSQAVSSTFNPLARDCTDYWLNSRIAGQTTSKILKPATILSLGEGNDGGDMTDARYNYPSLPAPWLSAEKSPCKRHLDGANYCFLDGHVKFIKPEQISTDSPNSNKPTFALK